MKVVKRVVLEGVDPHASQAGCHEDGTVLVVWREGSCYYSCLVFYGRGVSYESDNFGPFASAEEAERAAREDFEARAEDERVEDLWDALDQLHDEAFQAELAADEAETLRQVRREHSA